MSDEILAELKRALVAHRPQDEGKITRLVDVLRSHFPESAVGGHHGLSETLALPDPDDRHVLAAAIVGECDILVTLDIDDFPEEQLAPHDILLATPDDALMVTYFADPELVVACVERQRRALRRPPMSLDEFLRRLSQRAPHFTIAIGSALGIDPYQRIEQDMANFSEPTSPFGTVGALLDALLNRDEVAVASFIDHALAQELTGTVEPGGLALTEALLEMLGDAVDGEGWGFPSATRIAGPDEEPVKYVRGPQDLTIAHEPVLTEGHMFRLRHIGGAWIVVTIDEPDPALNEDPDDVTSP